ncbi:AMP-binding protein [Ornithinibacillus halophilus]|uniref:Acyl-CoA synthetase (AMP-forming)/AMP-acid ligase II n=1 Tax=Ornithinibacillus halophilus TaxID=930117 RepID=A0A1M5MAW7_9BACI|nr:AMP-binding protein [Ornithinibacillus halophilus]SHG74361.1 Acyl-CoA synthetase (AMP-forming)/AMP-acid ligase II [Ornithinibacillus halophilus]
MRLIRLFYVLYKIKLLSPLSIYRLITSILKNGLNLMTLLDFAEKKYSNKIALVDDQESISYHQLRSDAMKLAIGFSENYQIQKGQKVGFLCRNHASLIRALFAVSRIGADIYLLNIEMGKQQFINLVESHNFDCLIYDEEASLLIKESNYSNRKILSNHPSLPSIHSLINSPVIEKKAMPRTSGNRIVLLTSGTTGSPKAAIHRTSLFNYLNPFVAFIKRLKILDYHTSYVATPIFHGYGFAVFLLFIPLGKKSVITSKFEAKKATQLIHDHNVEVISVVPTMVQKLLRQNIEALHSIKVIASGGAKLSPKLIAQTSSKLGNVLFNLYGSSEAGLNFIATPDDLALSPNTIGKKINGLKIRILDNDLQEVDTGLIGQLCIKNKWSMSTKNNTWIETGDLGYCNQIGYYFISGRADDMIISGGENVYPIEVEKQIMKHPLIEDAAVIGISDEEFGQRLEAYVQPMSGTALSEVELLEWLRSSSIARYEMPKSIVFVEELPYTSLGKLDRKRLR